MAGLMANPWPTAIATVDVCAQCGKVASSRCSRCKMVCYCGKKCQKKDLQNHKGLCKHIAKLQNIVTTEEAKLRRLCWKEGSDSNPTAIADGDEDTKNMFETHAGMFGPWFGIGETCEYVEALAMLSQNCNLLGFISDYPSLPLWKRVAHFYQECLRLNPNDELSLHGNFPFVLINCNRDEDAFAFAVHHIKDPCEGWDLHRNTKEGDWVYGKVDLFTDIFEEIPEIGSMCYPGTLVSVLFIKLRMVAMFDGKKKEEITDEEAIKIQNVRDEQIPSLLDFIHKLNPTILPALIRPIPLLSQQLRPLMGAVGSPGQALGVLMDAIGQIIRTLIY